MPAIATGPRELDRKMYRVFHEADPQVFGNTTMFSEFLRRRGFVEFSYRREGESVMSTASTIERYIVYAQVISLIDRALVPSVEKAEVAELADFQGWLATRALDYLNQRKCTAEKIKSVARMLLGENPPRLPTVANIHEKLVSLIDRRAFEYSVRIVARLRPANFRLWSRPTFVIRGVVNG